MQTLGDMDADTFGDTFFSTLDGRDEDGISPQGTFPPGDDLVERDLRQLFNFDVDGEEDAVPETEMDDVKLLWKLRKELGDADFARIFEDERIKGYKLLKDKNGEPTQF